MKDTFSTDKRREMKRRTEDMKAVQHTATVKNAAGTSKITLPKPQAARLPKYTVPKAPSVKPPLITPKSIKSANTFYTKPVNSGIISSSEKPTSLAQFRNEIQARQDELAALNRQQYNEMLKGGKPDSLNTMKAQREAALKELQVQYAQAMGLGEKKPKASVKADAKNDKDFWDGFRKGLGLNEGEEVGGGLRDVGFAAQDTAAHKPGLIQGEGAFGGGTKPEQTEDCDPTEDDYVYVTEEEYEQLMGELNGELSERSESDEALPSNQDIYMKIAKLDENREWSLCVDIVVESEPGPDQGLQIAIDGQEFTQLKEMLGGNYEAALYLANFIIDEYGEKFADERTRDGIIAEIYIHDYLNRLIPDDLDYSSISNANMAEAIESWKVTAEELNLVFDGDANRQIAELIANITSAMPLGIIDESVLQQATYLFILNDYRDRYGIGALIDFFPF